jgi:hypothetical protein
MTQSTQEKPSPQKGADHAYAVMITVSLLTPSWPLQTQNAEHEGARINTGFRMKTLNKVLLTALVLVILALLVALPFGARILREEGMEGVWNRKRANIEKFVPDAAPVLDEVEKSVKSSGR